LNDATDFTTAMKPPLEELAEYCGEQEFTRIIRKSINDALTNLAKAKAEECSGGKPKVEAKNSCSPSARVESLNESIGTQKNTYEEVVIDNNCKQPVRFQYSIGSKSYWSNCAPSMRSGFHTGNRTSSTDMASLNVGEKWQACK